MPRPESVSPVAERELVAAARARDAAAIRTIVRQNNRRLFRVARAILKDDAEAEDAVQEAYVRAFTHLAGFEEKASLATWLTRIVINEALGRARRRRPVVELDAVEPGGRGATVVPFPHVAAQPDPERAMAQHQVHALLEQAIDALPEAFRVVLVARAVEEMSVEETAALFNLKPETVKSRLHRARALLRKNLEARVGPLLTETFPFDGRRCVAMAERVLARLAAAP